MQTCYFKFSDKPNERWVEANFHGFHPEGNYKETGVYSYALVVPVNPNDDPSGYARPRKIFNFVNLVRFDTPEPPIPVTDDE